MGTVTIFRKYLAKDTPKFTEIQYAVINIQPLKTQIFIIANLKHLHVSAVQGSH